LRDIGSKKKFFVQPLNLAYLYTNTQRRRFNVAHGYTVSVAEFNFRFSARHLVITARASAAQSSSCLLTQSDGANSKFRELLHSRRLYRNFNKSLAPLPRMYAHATRTVIFALKIVVEWNGVICRRYAG